MVTTRAGSRTGTAAALLAVLLGVAGCTGEGLGGQGSDAAAPAGSALKAVGDLTVKGRAPKTGYARDQFGSSWVDTDHNGCDTRDDILQRDLTSESFRSDDGGDCVVTSGKLDDPYTGKGISFTRGRSTIDIDHVVALSDAWQKGAKYWDRDKRIQVANDPLNLLAVDGPANRGKGDADAATWLPPNKAFRCPYVARQVAVKKKYGLWVTAAEKDAMTEVLRTCPDERLPGSGKPDVPGAAPSGTGGGSGDDKPGSGATTYPNCAAARKAGAAPLHRGDPGYSRDLDRDGDGVACDT